MKYYATLLNIEEAENHTLEHDDLVDATLQDSISNMMVWGHGKTREESIKIAVENLIDNGLIETFECIYGAEEILQASGGKEALRHLWLDDDAYHGNSKLIPLPCHNTLVNFCNRYSLPEKAARELTSFFKAFLHPGS